MEDPENFWVILWILKVTRSPCSENLCWNKHNFFVNESTGAPVVDWLVVWNINFIFPYIGNNHPNWLIFFSGVQTTNQFWTSLKVWVFLRSYPRSLTQKPTQIVDERVMTSVFSREAWWYLDPHDMFFLCWWSFPSQLLVLYRTGNQLIFCHGKANDITIGQVGTENINSGAPHEKSIIRITYSIWCILYACIRAWFLCPIFFQTSPNYWKNSKKINNRYTYIYIYICGLVMWHQSPRVGTWSSQPLCFRFFLCFMKSTFFHGEIFRWGTPQSSWPPACWTASKLLCSSGAQGRRSATKASTQTTRMYVKQCHKPPIWEWFIMAYNGL